MKIVNIISVMSVLINLAIGYILIDSYRINRETISQHTRDVVEANFQLTEQIKKFNDQAELRNASQIMSISNRFGENQLLIFDQLEKQRKIIADLKSMINAKELVTLIVTADSIAEVKPDTVAVSKDLYDKGWTIGKRVHIEGEGIKTIARLMDERWEKRINILYTNKIHAKKFGKRQLTVALLAI